MTKADTAHAIRAAALAFKRQENKAAKAKRPSSSLDTQQVPLPGSISVRRMHLRDLRHLATRINVTYLDQPTALIDRSGVFATGLRAQRPLDRMRPIVHLAFAHPDEFLGVVQFRQVAPDRRWIALALGVVDGCTEIDRVTEQLLEFSIRRAGGRGIKRLFARLPSESELSEHFRACGFEPYMRESILQVPEAQGLTLVSTRVREQEPADTWAVHQLYHASAPRHVQFAEAWTSHRWDPAAARSTHPSKKSYVIDDEYQIGAHARVLCGNHTVVIEAMYLADRQEYGIELVRDVVRRVVAESSRNHIYVTVRAHQAELESALHSLGAVHFGSQDLTVRYTAAKVTGKPIEAVVPLTHEVLERVPKRVPTYMKHPNNGVTQ